MTVDVLDDPAAVARRAARLIAVEARAAIAAAGNFAFAVSGGRTPWSMLAALAAEPVPWGAVHLFQVDERVAPDGDPDRNWTHVVEHLVARVELPPAQLHAMRVNAEDLAAASEDYARALQAVAGRPSVLDLVHLGLGSDGHTASLVPGDPVLDVADRDVAATAAYQGRRRMTLTYPVLDRARVVLWVVTGAEKADMLSRLCAGDLTLPAGRVCQDRAVVLADRQAAARL